MRRLHRSPRVLEGKSKPTISVEENNPSSTENKENEEKIIEEVVTDQQSTEAVLNIEPSTSEDRGENDVVERAPNIDPKEEQMTETKEEVITGPVEQLTSEEDLGKAANEEIKPEEEPIVQQSTTNEATLQKKVSTNSDQDEENAERVHTD